MRLPPKFTLFPYTTLFRSERPLKDIRDEYNYPKKKGIKDECSRLLEASSNLDRKSGSAGMPRPISYAVFCLKKKKRKSWGPWCRYISSCSDRDSDPCCCH